MDLQDHLILNVGNVICQHSLQLFLERINFDAQELLVLDRVRT
jgi:hypothetical protein